MKNIMSDIKELSDDELASVVGGVGDDVNCKYPTGTTLIFVETKFEETRVFYEIISSDVQDDTVYHSIRQYAMNGGSIVFDIINELQLSDDNIDSAIAQGFLEVYNG